MEILREIGLFLGDAFMVILRFLRLAIVFVLGIAQRHPKVFFGTVVLGGFIYALRFPAFLDLVASMAALAIILAMGYGIIKNSSSSKTKK